MGAVIKISSGLWAFRWPAVGGKPGKWVIRRALPGRPYTSEAIYVVDDFGNMVEA